MSRMSRTMDEEPRFDPQLIKFLKVADTARWRDVPKVWNVQLRAALGDSLVKVGWGGVIELTEAGKIASRF